LLNNEHKALSFVKVTKVCHSVSHFASNTWRLQIICHIHILDIDIVIFVSCNWVDNEKGTYITIRILKLTKEYKKVKVNVSRKRPRVVQTVPGGLDSHIFMTFGT
jgi:hypothetical protein